MIVAVALGVAAAVLLGLIPAVIASRKGEPFGEWWLYGSIVWPLAMIHVVWLDFFEAAGARADAKRSSHHTPPTL